MKTIHIIILFLVSAILLSACQTIPEDEAITFVTEYLGYVENDDYDAIEKMSCFTDDKYIEEAFIRLETDTGLDFSDGIKFNNEISVTYSTHSDSYFGTPLSIVIVNATIENTHKQITLAVLQMDDQLKIGRIDIDDYFIW